MKIGKCKDLVLTIEEDDDVPMLELEDDVDSISPPVKAINPSRARNDTIFHTEPLLVIINRQLVVTS